jgi:hypothetical protein
MNSIIVAPGISASNWLKSIWDLVNVGSESKYQSSSTDPLCFVPYPPFVRIYNRLDAIFRKHPHPSQTEIFTRHQ